MKTCSKCKSTKCSCKSKKNYYMGGVAKNYAKGGYANCGASTKSTQKSTNMMRGGMPRYK